MRRPSPQRGSKMAACPSPSSEAAQSLDAHDRGRTGMPESLGATRPYPYPHSPASFTSAPREKYIGEPCPCDLPPPSLASPRRAGISAFRLSLPVLSPPTRPLLHVWSVESRALGFSDRAGAEALQHQRWRRRPLSPLPRTGLASESSLRPWASEGGSPPPRQQL